jgi:hypothetical protein
LREEVLDTVVNQLLEAEVGMLELEEQMAASFEHRLGELEEDLEETVTSLHGKMKGVEAAAQSVAERAAGEAGQVRHKPHAPHALFAHCHFHRHCHFPSHVPVPARSNRQRHALGQHCLSREPVLRLKAPWRFVPPTYSTGAGGAGGPPRGYRSRPGRTGRHHGGGGEGHPQVMQPSRLPSHRQLMRALGNSLA